MMHQYAPNENAIEQVHITYPGPKESVCLRGPFWNKKYCPWDVFVCFCPKNIHVLFCKASVKGSGPTCLALNTLLEAMDVPSGGVDELAVNQSRVLEKKICRLIAND
jgi:hypothetical protein